MSAGDILFCVLLGVLALPIAVAGVAGSLWASWFIISEIRELFR